MNRMKREEESRESCHCMAIPAFFGGWGMSLRFVVVSFFLLLFLSLWRGGKAARWIGLAKWVEEEEGLSEVRDSELLSYGVFGRPRTGLLGLGVGETSLGGGNRFGKFWSRRERVERRLPRMNRNCGVPAVPGPRPDSIQFGRKER